MGYQTNPILSRCEGKDKNGSNMKIRKNLSIGIFAVIIAFMAWAFSFSQIDLSLSGPNDLHLSPKTFPMIAILILFVFGGMNIFNSLVLKKDEYVKLEKSELKALWCFLALIMYLFLFKILGFILCTTAISSFILYLEGSKNWKYYFIILLLSIVVFVVFRYGMSVTKLPLGYPLRWVIRGRYIS